MRLLTRLEGRVPALHALLTRSHARRFDALAPSWDTIRADVADSRRMLERALDELGVTAPARVLDVGTGTGQAAGILARAAFPARRSTRSTRPREMIELARAKPELSGVRFAVADGGRLPYPGRQLRPRGLAARAAVRARAAARARAGRLGALLLPDGPGHADLVPDRARRAAPRARGLRGAALRDGRPRRVDRRAALDAPRRWASRAREAPARRCVPGRDGRRLRDRELPARLMATSRRAASAAMRRARKG